MTPRSAFIALIALACFAAAFGLAAGLASAAPKGRVTLVVPVKPGPAGLRGSQPAVRSPGPLATAALRGFTPLPFAARPSADPEQCRLTCAHAYYLCLADQDAAADCPQSWSSCDIACDPGSTPFARPPAA